MTRNNSTIMVYKRLSDDVKQLIADYIPGNDPFFLYISISRILSYNKT